jgi:hypothetical protein
MYKATNYKPLFETVQEATNYLLDRGFVSIGDGKFYDNMFGLESTIIEVK